MVQSFSYYFKIALLSIQHFIYLFILVPVNLWWFSRVLTILIQTFLFFFFWYLIVSLEGWDYGMTYSTNFADITLHNSLKFFVVCFLTVEFYCFFYFEYKTFIRHVFCNYFTLVFGLSFDSLNNILHREENFNFNDVQLNNIYFMDNVFGLVSKNLSPKLVWNFFLILFFRSFIGFQC